MPWYTSPPESFSEFYDRYYAYIRNYVYGHYIHNDPAESPEDVVQEVLGAAWQEYAKLRDSLTCHAWLRRAAWMRLVARRRYWVTHEHPLSLEAPRVGGDDEIPSLRETVAGAPVSFDDGLVVDELLDHMPADDRSLMQRIARGDTVSSIAREHKITPEAVRQRLWRARARVMARLEVA